jgi:hypothetical protein
MKTVLFTVPFLAMAMAYKPDETSSTTAAATTTYTKPSSAAVSTTSSDTRKQLGPAIETDYNPGLTSESTTAAPKPTGGYAHGGDDESKHTDAGSSWLDVSSTLTWAGDHSSATESTWAYTNPTSTLVAQTSAAQQTSAAASSTPTGSTYDGAASNTQMGAGALFLAGIAYLL